MRISFFAMAATALLVCSCSNNEVLETASVKKGQVIELNAYTPRYVDTRTTVTEKGDVTPGFYVEATCTNDADNKYGFTDYYSCDATGTCTSIDTDNPHYWPFLSTQMMSFYALYNGQTATTVPTAFPISNGVATIEAIVPGAQTEQVDVMVASSEEAAAGASVNLTFEHVLTEVRANISAANTEGLELTKLELVGPKDGTYSIQEGAWSDFTTTTSATYPIFTKVVSYYIQNTATPVYDNINAEARVASSVLVLPTSYTLNLSCASGATTVNLQATVDLSEMMGKRVTLNIVLNDANQIEFTTSVSAWDDQSLDVEPEEI